ncbi:hypothetical protein L211DRAFT_839383 [Terfezia boudieri ATCC MYA-4762]|uniref:Uncharacterized protein n=1 Tax=Terfezia boudieri ATCC MYA-4762 TaxID=1051890 RepID=A0A3N4LIE7_9PEZI|nr:hypothetical protein L211DRAFT_839383 [Terfezia boudieri ATCC MYA-4762]
MGITFSQELKLAGQKEKIMMGPPPEAGGHSLTLTSECPVRRARTSRVFKTLRKARSAVLLSMILLIRGLLLLVSGI